MPVVKMQVNGTPVEVNCEEESLLDVLRDRLGLTGTKRGCDAGFCGSCAVLVGGEARMACRQTAADMDGADVTTVEGLERGAIHEAFENAFASQCGFCTPGMIVATTALLRSEPKPSREAIRRALRPHLCRCTGYAQIEEAVLVASGQMTLEESRARLVRVELGEMRPTRVIGSAVPRLDAPLQTTGKAVYSADFRREGTLQGAFARVGAAPCKIKRLDTTEAENADGVVRVLTAEDLPGENVFGKMVRDWPVFAADTVRFAGEPCALVLAESVAQARAAALKVLVETEPLEAVYDPLAAMEEGAPKVHERGNVLYHYHLERGTERPRSSGDATVGLGFTTPPQQHAPLEPEASFAYVEGGTVVVRSTGQSVFFDRLNVARALGLPVEDVRVVQPAVGGGFGKREDITTAIHAALGAFVTRKPVLVELTREESLSFTTTRTAQRTRVEIRASRDGTLEAFRARVVGDAGAYATWSPNIQRKAGVLAAGPYRIPRVLVDSYAVYTNNPPSGAARGFGAAETAFCTESAMDELAYALGVDPLALRKRNLLSSGETTATGSPAPEPFPALQTLEACERRFDWERRRASCERGTGVGVAVIEYGIGFGSGIEDKTSCVVELHEDGGLTLFVGPVDYGNGFATLAAAIASEVTGVSVGKIRVVNADTELTTNCGSTVASKQTFTTGRAVYNACALLAGDLRLVAAKRLRLDTPSGVELRDDGAVSTAGSVPVSELFGELVRASRPTRREGVFNAKRLTEPPDPKTGEGRIWHPMAVGAHMAHVRVDERNGKVEILKYVAAHFVGRTMNAPALRGQVLGGVSFGLGYALTEDLGVTDGRVTHDNFGTYRIPRIDDCPDVTVIAVEQEVPEGPFGAIGVGEPPTVAVAPCIANAFRHATGVRPLALPLTPARVKALLR